RPLNYLTDLLNRIGPDGMSEDEEDGSKDQPQFIVLTPQWRALELTMLLRKLDKLHMLMRTKGRTRPSKGSAPRLRIIKSDPVYFPDRPAPIGLPMNLYSAAWLNAKQPDWHKN
ncbi:MAG: hypothetical protein NXY57DRAFT_858235, partial [Lentinula lateritia]